MTTGDSPLLFMTPDEAHSRLEQASSAVAPLVTRTVRGWKCQTKTALHDEVGAALQFPSYYGENWDALDECITDFSWQPAQRYLIVVTGVESLLPADDDSLRIFLEVLVDAAVRWAGRGVSFEVILTGDQAGLDRVSAIGQDAIDRRHAPYAPAGNVPCPACGFCTVPERHYGTYAICELCGWEDDGAQLANPACGGGANGESLIEAQEDALRRYPFDPAGANRTGRDRAWRPLRREEIALAEREHDEQPWKNPAIYDLRDAYWFEKP